MGYKAPSSSVNTQRVFLSFLFAIFVVACDQSENVTGGTGSNEKVSTNAGAKSSLQSEEIAAEPKQPIKIRLNAFSDFNCTSNWVNRDGGLGLKAGTESGTCSTSFPGASAKYRVTLMAQTEFDGAPYYRINIDRNEIASGRYPVSKGKLICDCPNWQANCPDRVVPVDAGVHTITYRSVVEFFGQEVNPCGSRSNGAYAKWRELVFTPN